MTGPSLEEASSPAAGFDVQSRCSGGCFSPSDAAHPCRPPAPGVEPGGQRSAHRLLLEGRVDCLDSWRSTCGGSESDSYPGWMGRAINPDLTAFNGPIPWTRLEFSPSRGPDLAFDRIIIHAFQKASILRTYSPMRATMPNAAHRCRVAAPPPALPTQHQRAGAPLPPPSRLCCQRGTRNSTPAPHIPSRPSTQHLTFPCLYSGWRDGAATSVAAPISSAINKRHALNAAVKSVWLKQRLNSMGGINSMRHQRGAGDKAVKWLRRRYKHNQRRAWRRRIRETA